MKTLSLIIILLFINNILLPCTVFFGADGNNVLAGNNEDGRNPHTKIWFIPAQDGKYGRMYIGYNDGIRQGGMNEMGLFFDTTSAPGYEMAHLDGDKTYRGDLITKAMEESKNVTEVITLFKKYGPFIDRHHPVPTVYGVIIFGDKEGNAVILEGDHFEIKENKYILATNYHKSRNHLGGFPCKRFEITDKMLKAQKEYTVDYFRSILDAVHIEHDRGWNPTVYSSIYDLKKGLVYIYFFHNFSNTVIINLRDELSRGSHEIDIPSLFPETFSYQLYTKSNSGRRNIKNNIFRMLQYSDSKTTLLTLLLAAFVFNLILFMLYLSFKLIRKILKQILKS